MPAETAAERAEELSKEMMAEKTEPPTKPKEPVRFIIVNKGMLNNSVNSLISTDFKAAVKKAQELCVEKNETVCLCRIVGDVMPEVRPKWEYLE